MGTTIQQSLSNPKPVAELARMETIFDISMVCQTGVFEQRMSKAPDGFEMTWAVNVMAPFLLTSLLLDRVTDRIINVSSISAGSSIDFSNLQQVNPEIPPFSRSHQYLCSLCRCKLKYPSCLVRCHLI